MQNNQEAPRRRGRPRKEAAEIRHASVRIRPGLQAQLAEAAAQTGQSIAAEVEQRIAASFAAPPMREPTRELLYELAEEIGVIDITARELEGVKGWEDSLLTFAMVREILGNGPIAHFIPHPPGSSATTLTESNTRLRQLMDEREALEQGLEAWGLRPVSPDAPQLGSALSHVSRPDRADLLDAMEGRADIPTDFKKIIAEQVGRLERLDDRIDEQRRHIAELTAPYYAAQEAGRRYYYEKRGLPDLATWMTAPVGLDEPPPRGMFGATKRGSPA